MLPYGKSTDAPSTRRHQVDERPANSLRCKQFIGKHSSTNRHIPLPPFPSSFVRSFHIASLTVNMSLTALPSELLFQVAELICRTAPKNVLDFALTSRRLRAVAGPLTEECRKLTQDYKEKDVNNFGAAEVLFEICKRPWVALHLKKLRLAAARSWRTLERPKNKKQLAVVQAFNLRRSDISDDDLEHLVLQSGLVPTQDAVVWKNAINVGDEDYLFALLLASLPNLEHLVIRLDSNKMEQVKEMVRAIKRKWPERKTLPNIKSVKVLEREGASSCDLEIFPLFAAIPGVEIIQGGVCIY